MAFEQAFIDVAKQFDIQDLLPEQKDCIKAFFEKKNIFVNLPTGYGKSLIFQCLPLVADIVQGKPRGSSVMMVVSPLNSLMDEQVSKLNNLGIPSVSLVNVDDPDLIQQVVDGLYVVVYCSPESLLSGIGRDVLSDVTFRSMVIGIAIDEAHCITQWGVSKAKHKSAFRKWYGCLGEIQSLMPDTCHLLILTATATASTKKEILQSLNLQNSDIHFIEQSPNKKNLFYSKQYMDKNESLETQFGALIEEVKKEATNTVRTIIYCQTRKQCSVLFRLFEVHLGSGIFYGPKNPKNRMVQMYHAGSPKPVKDFISENIAEQDGHVRVLISTIAFGMGIDCKGVHRIVHFGPPKTIESYVQECGRAGRDGLPSSCVLLYNGLTSVYCDSSMKTFLESENTCLRMDLMAHFQIDKASSITSVLHQCCHNCAKHCNCNNCGTVWSPYREMKETFYPSNLLTRTVNSQEKKLLKEKLLELQKDNIKEKKLENVVGCPNVLFEFNTFHIKQILDSCHQLFSVKDVLNHVEIWRYSYAVKILQIVTQIFGDTNFECEILDEEDFDITLHSEWSQIRDDSLLHELLDTNDLEDIGSLMNSTSNSVE